MALGFRQLHVDFHNSPEIQRIGEAFDKREWQASLRGMQVDTVTLFSLCHHGLSYHPTKVGRMHPGLSFDLLRAQMEACREIGVRVRIYLSAGLNERLASEHPEWREVTADGQLAGGVFSANYHKLCFNTGYLDALCALTEEAVALFPEADGVFFDIVCQHGCCCAKCVAEMLAAGLDPSNASDRAVFARRVLLNYYARATAAARSRNASMAVFHNAGNIRMGDREVLEFSSHLELESLPTGGWGYDHYPLVAAYSRSLGMDFLGMTGIFHTTWGEFGGYKHPAALRYECCAMLATGSKCSIGVQLHPSGRLQGCARTLVGGTYGEVASKERFCAGATSLAEIAVLSALSTDASSPARLSDGDIGAARMLLESQMFFDVVDAGMELGRYKMVVVPDGARLDDGLVRTLLAYCRRGGKVVLAGRGVFGEDGTCALLPGVKSHGEDPFTPNYVQAASAFAPDFVGDAPFVAYGGSERITVSSGEVLGVVVEPCFQRSWRHFSSHQHAPWQGEASPWASGVILGNVLYFAHPVFSWYRGWGAVAAKQYAVKAMCRLLGAPRQIEGNLPASARATLMWQASENRAVLHLLYATPVLRGGALQGGGGLAHGGVEVIEELPVLHGVSLSVRLARRPRQVRLEPEGREIAFGWRDGRMLVEIPQMQCHRMVVCQF